MGFFSWLTSDTKNSIANAYTRRCRTVYFLQPNGRHIRDDAYDGYGRFGGIDVYEWLARMNLPEDELKGLDAEAVRRRGLKLAFDTPERIRYPLKFSFSPKADYGKLPAAENCRHQGFFYDF